MSLRAASSAQEVCYAVLLLYTFLCASVVLPPIPTTGLTAADVPALVNLAREQMLAVLNDISTHAPPAPSPKPLAPLPDPGSISSVTAVLSDVVSEHATAMPEDAVSEPKAAASRESLASSAFEGVAGSENGTETEEDDEGMVLVGRPA
jgi:lysophosphatidate acyltransferase